MYFNSYSRSHHSILFEVQNKRSIKNLCDIESKILKLILGRIPIHTVGSNNLFLCPYQLVHMRIKNHDHSPPLGQTFS